VPRGAIVAFDCLRAYATAAHNVCAQRTRANVGNTVAACASASEVIVPRRCTVIRINFARCSSLNLANIYVHPTRPYSAPFTTSQLNAFDCGVGVKIIEAVCTQFLFPSKRKLGIIIKILKT